MLREIRCWPDAARFRVVLVFFERKVNSVSLSLWMSVLSSQEGTVDGIATPTTVPVTSSARRITLRLASRRKNLKSPLPPIPLSTWMVSEGGQAK